MRSFIIKFILFALLCTAIFSCNAPHHHENRTIEMIGFNELTIDGLQPCINVNFNGDKATRDKLIQLMESDAMKPYRVKKNSENFYKDGAGTSAQKRPGFTYGINYLIVLTNESEKEKISQLLLDSNIPVSINSNGYYLDPQQNTTLQDQAFQNALHNAKLRLQHYADGVNANFEIISISEIDDYQLYPMDGIIYNDKLIKKVKVKAELLSD
ncbi:hypothetical protein [Echinicola sp. 20G]|uniref:hypothetical protein n=1 Tax=Echinicola sp. 20G TaxID=2781961 RepID=UPI0019108FEC|nr:hypothetical protein [Echinicola sp. 20G]